MIDSSSFTESSRAMEIQNGAHRWSHQKVDGREEKQRGEGDGVEIVEIGACHRRVGQPEQGDQQSLPAVVQNPAGQKKERQGGDSEGHRLEHEEGLGGWSEGIDRRDQEQHQRRVDAEVVAAHERRVEDVAVHRVPEDVLLDSEIEGGGAEGAVVPDGVDGDIDHVGGDGRAEQHPRAGFFQGWRDRPRALSAAETRFAPRSSRRPRS